MPASLRSLFRSLFSSSATSEVRGRADRLWRHHGLRQIEIEELVQTIFVGHREMPTLRNAPPITTTGSRPILAFKTVPARFSIKVAARWYRRPTGGEIKVRP
jgi:hypothetical protein